MHVASSRPSASWRAKILPSTDPRVRLVLKERLLSFEQQLSSSHEPLNFDKLFHFVSTHVQDVDVPHLVIHDERNVLRGEEWIILCAIHPDVDEDGELRRLWLPYLEKQPNYAPGPPSEYFYQAVTDAKEYDPNTTSSFGLEHALQVFTMQPNCSELEILFLVQEYIRLGATAALLWQYRWREYGILRGGFFPLQCPEIHDVWTDINDEYRHTLSDWQHRLSVEVRRKLAEFNFVGEFLYLINHVFAQVIAPAGSTIREDEFASAFQRWIVVAATRPNVDPHGHVARIIEQEGLSPDSTNVQTPWRSPVRPFFSWDPYADHETLVDVQFVPYGPRNKVEDFAEQILHPENGFVCTICQEEFGNDVDEASCRQLDVCGHQFHWDCLDEYVNATHLDIVGCPNCRVTICDARLRRPRRAEGSRRRHRRRSDGSTQYVSYGGERGWSSPIRW
jgi:hypothetical protein